MKICRVCKKEKDCSEFGINRARADGINTICKVCANKKNSEFKKSKHGVITAIYGDQRRSSRTRGDAYPDYSLSWLKDWMGNHPEFDRLYEGWRSSGYSSAKRPSVDRKDDYLPYSKDNISLTTWEQNKKKGEKDRYRGANNKTNRAVLKMSMSGDILHTYHSAAEAARQCDLTGSNILAVCSKKKGFKTAGGFLWRFRDG